MAQSIWLITGCTSGFGEQFVHDILSRGDKAIATGRSLSRLSHLEAAGAATLQLDITETQQSIRDTIAKAISVYGRIDVLVNNASYISIGTWEDLEYGASPPLFLDFEGDLLTFVTDMKTFSHSLIQMSLAPSK